MGHLKLQRGNANRSVMKRIGRYWPRHWHLEFSIWTDDADFFGAGLATWAERAGKTHQQQRPVASGAKIIRLSQRTASSGRRGRLKKACQRVSTGSKASRQLQTAGSQQIQSSLTDSQAF